MQPSIYWLHTMVHEPNLFLHEFRDSFIVTGTSKVFNRIPSSGPFQKVVHGNRESSAIASRCLETGPSLPLSMLFVEDLGDFSLVLEMSLIEP